MDCNGTPQDTVVTLPMFRFAGIGATAATGRPLPFVTGEGAGSPATIADDILEVHDGLGVVAVVGVGVGVGHGNAP